MLIDSHCHIHHLGLQEHQISNLIQKSNEVGIHKMINVSITLDDVHILRLLSDKYNSVYHTIGLHPSDVLKHKLPNKETLIELANYSKCVAIGETGLDFSQTLDTQHRELQYQSFRIHIEASLSTNKPLIIHSRRAEQACIDLLKQYPNIKGVLHCFTGDLHVAKQAIDLGLYISFSGILTFKNASIVREVAQKLPISHILVETDAPYLTPAPFRGKYPNIPEYVVFVAQELALLRQDSYQNIADKTNQNATNLFKL